LETSDFRKKQVATFLSPISRIFMKRLFFTALLTIASVAAFFLSFTFTNQGNQTAADQSASENAQIQKIRKNVEDYGKLPLIFEPNLGQTDEKVKFISRGHGYGLFLTGTEAVLSLQKQGKNNSAKTAVVKMQVVGADTDANAVGLDETEGKTNYFIGNNPADWQTNVSNFKRVKYESIYSGVDMIYYGNGRELEYDFVVAPEVNPNQIKLRLEGVSNARIEKETGDLLMETEVGTLRQHKPISYQNINGERQEIASNYKLEKANYKTYAISFALGEYDKSKELVIDPILVYGSYLGGNLFDEGRAIAVDASGNAYVAGTTISLDFPTTAGTIKPTLLPRTDINSYWYDAFVTKVNPTGTAVVFSTYFGGRNSNEVGTGVAVDASGNVFLGGTTNGADTPTLNAFQATFGGADDAFLAKLNPTGSALVYSTYIGGNSTETGSKISVNQATGEAVFVGNAYSTNFPTTPNVIQPTLSGLTSDGFVAKFSPTGAARFITLFGGTAGELVNDVALDASGDIYFVGQTSSSNFPVTAGAFQTAYSGNIDGFIAKINATGTAVAYASYLGGGLQSDRANGVAVDGLGNAYVAGQTENVGFPTTAGAFDQTFNGGSDAFLTKFNSTGTALIYSTFLGSTGSDKAFAVGLGENNNAFVAGETSSLNFPLRNSLTVRGTQDGSTNNSIFLTRFNETATAQVFSTILGVGGAYDVAVDGASSAYLTGHALNLTVTPNAFQTLKGGYPNLSTTADGFVAKVGAADENAQTYSISGSVSDQNGNFADYTPILVTISGTVNRQYMLPYGGGSGNTYFFGALPAGGNYTVTARKLGYPTDPENAVFNNLQANQFADFVIQPNQKPVGVITSPAHGATFNAPAAITITATASDPDGHAITKVDFYAYSNEAGNVHIGTDTTAPYEFTWTSATVGTWSLSAIPTDSLGLRGVSTPTVHIQVFNSTAPTVVLTSPTNGASYAQGMNIPISATVSSSINVVEFYEGTNLIGRRTGAPWSMTWRPLQTGTYSVTAKGFTASGQTVTSNPASVTVTPINHVISGRIISSIDYSPVANITVNLTGANSFSRTTTTNANGEYSFTDLGLTPDDGVTITPVSSNHTFYPAQKTISYLGYVNWNEVFSATPITGITVSLISPTEGQTFVAPATINLAANASSTAGAITKVEFMLRGTGGVFTVLGTDTTAPYTFDWTGIPTGNYFLAARATDATNAVAQTGEVRVTVNQQAATVSISGQVVDASGYGMPGIRLQLSGSQTQIAVTNLMGYYGFYSLQPGGNFTVTPQVIGTSGNTYSPASQSFSNLTANQLDVNFAYSSINQAPTVQFNTPTTGAIFNMPVAIPINATATDADGNIVHFTVSATRGNFTLTIGQTNTGTFNAPWQPNLPGIYTLTATARDNGGRQTSAQIQITVNQPAPVSIGGRVVNRDSQGIEGVTLELKNYPEEEGEPVATATTDANGNYTLPNITTFGSYVLRASKQNYTFAPQQRIYLNLAVNQTADFTGTLVIPPSDFDGDSRSDVAVWRPSTGVWHILKSNGNQYTGIQFGAGSLGDIAVPGNYDGDMKIDIAVFRNGHWYIYQSSNNQVRGVAFGFADDKPMPGDFDGDGKTDIAVFRPSNGYWYILRSSDNQVTAVQWGFGTDKPLVGDFDGDGICDIAVWRASNGGWYVRQSSDGNLKSLQFGAEGDIPLAGDFDGDKRADFTVFRPSNGVWYTLRSSNNQVKYFQWGNLNDTPVAGDYDLDGKTDYAVFRKTEGNWYIFKSTTNSHIVQQFGENGDMPIPAASIR
jgi:hypothetical protein